MVVPPTHTHKIALSFSKKHEQVLFSVTIILLIISGISIITELSVVITAIILVIAIIMRIITGGVGLGLYLTVSLSGWAT